MIVTVLAFTVLACTKEEQEQPKFDLGGEWRTDIYYDQLFELDSAVDIYKFNPITKYCTKYLYRDGVRIGIASYEYEVKSDTVIKFSTPFMSHEQVYKILDNNTILVKHYNNWIITRKQ